MLVTHPDITGIVWFTRGVSSVIEFVLDEYSGHDGFSGRILYWIPRPEKCKEVGCSKSMRKPSNGCKKEASLLQRTKKLSKFRNNTAMHAN